MIAVFYIEGRLPQRKDPSMVLSIREKLEGIMDEFAPIYSLDGGNGWSYNETLYRKMSKAFDDIIILTNCPCFLSVGGTWYKKQKKHLVWFNQLEGWTHVNDLTEKELRAGHSIEKIYRNGGLDELL